MADSLDTNLTTLQAALPQADQAYVNAVASAQANHIDAAAAYHQTVTPMAGKVPSPELNAAEAAAWQAMVTTRQAVASAAAAARTARQTARDAALATFKAAP